MIRAGLLRTRVALQEKTETNTDGVVTETWATVVNRSAEFVSTTGREFVNAKAVDSDLAHLLRMRYWSDLTASHRILDGSRVYGILSVVNVGNRRAEMLVSCKEVV